MSPAFPPAPPRVAVPVAVPPGPRRLGWVLAAIFLLAATASPVMAHAELVSSDPEDAAVLDVPPSAVTLTFSDGLNQARSRFVLTGPDGARVGTGRAVQDGDKVMTLSGLTLTPGGYTIQWTSVALDGDVLRGTLSFTVSEATPTPAATAGPATPTATAGEPTPTPTTNVATPPATAGPATPAPTASEDAVAPSATSGGDVLLPIALGLLLVAAIGVVVLRRSRGAG